MSPSDELDNVFDEAMQSVLQKKSDVVSFESSSRQTITNPEINVLFDAAWDSVTGNKNYTVKISTEHTEHIAADAAVLRIASQAANIASRTVLSLKNFRKAPLILSKQVDPLSLILPMPLRIASSLIDLFFWGIISTVIVGLLLPNLEGSAFWLIVVGSLPIVGAVTSSFFVAMLRKTFGEIVWGLVPYGKRINLISRAFALPLFWLTPLCLINLFRKEPIQEAIFGVSVKGGI